MPTPSSGTICWSQIQAVIGGSYCMSNFNAVSGRGYCASDYYNYPSIICYIFDIYNPDQNYDVYLNYTECNGTAVATTVGPQNIMSVCAQDFSVFAPGGIITNTSVLCVP